MEKRGKGRSSDQTGEYQEATHVILTEKQKHQEGNLGGILISGKAGNDTHSDTLVESCLREKHRQPGR